MNHYGAKAAAHWRRHLPQQLKQIQDPEEFFTLLGETASQEIEDRTDAIADLTPERAGYLEESARRATARTMAESQVMREMILVDPDDPEAVAQLLG